jgi:hypothetical protein
MISSRALSNSGTLCSVCNLELRGNRLQPDDAAVIAFALPHAHSLTRLDMSDNNICTEGAVALSRGLDACQTLHTLLLRTNRLTGVHPFDEHRGVVALAQAIGKSNSIEVVDLRGNKIEKRGPYILEERHAECADAIADAVLANPQLQRIALAKTWYHLAELRDGADIKTAARGGYDPSLHGDLANDRASASAAGGMAAVFGGRHTSSSKPHRQVLSHLDYRRNKLDGTEILILVRMLEYNSTITSLDLRKNYVAPFVKNRIGEALMRSTVRARVCACARVRV